MEQQQLTKPISSPWTGVSGMVATAVLIAGLTIRSEALLLSLAAAAALAYLVTKAKSQGVSTAQITAQFALWIVGGIGLYVVGLYVLLIAVFTLLP